MTLKFTIKLLFLRLKAQQNGWLIPYPSNKLVHIRDLWLTAEYILQYLTLKIKWLKFLNSTYIALKHTNQTEKN